MHSRGYLFASCLKLSNNLLIKEDWKPSTSDLAAWGLQSPCRPPAQPSAAAPVLLRPSGCSGRRAQPPACRGSCWVTLAKAASQTRRSALQRLSREMPFRLACRTTDTLCVFALRTDAASAPAVCGPCAEAACRGARLGLPCGARAQRRLLTAGGRESGNAPPCSGPGRWRGGPLPSTPAGSTPCLAPAALT